MNRHTKKFEQKMNEAVQALNELKQVFSQLDESDMKIVENANKDIVGMIDDFRKLRQKIVADIKKNDVVSKMSLVCDDNATTITLGDKEYVLQMPFSYRNMAQDEYCFPQENPSFVMFVNRSRGTISIGTKDEKAKEMFKGLKGFHKELNVTETGMIVNVISHYAEIDLHDKLLQTFADAVNLITA